MGYARYNETTQLATTLLDHGIWCATVKDQRPLKHQPFFDPLIRDAIKLCGVKSELLKKKQLC